VSSDVATLATAPFSLGQPGAAALQLVGILAPASGAQRAH
jgi:hypothetical protein